MVIDPYLPLFIIPNKRVILWTLPLSALDLKYNIKNSAMISQQTPTIEDKMSCHTKFPLFDYPALYVAKE